MDWEDLIDEDSLAALLPLTHSFFARPIKEGLVVFLSGLPAEVQTKILAEQAELPLDASVSTRLGALGRQCPVLHKLGQTLARDKRLAEELRGHLRPLESLAPTTPLEIIEETLAAEFGDLHERGIRLLPPAIAEASVAVVIPFELTSEAGVQKGVFKVLKPGIERRLRLELDLLSEVGAHLEDECHRLGIPELDYRETFRQIRTSLSSEVDLALEQHNLREAHRAFADEKEIIVPALLDCCSSRVTAMQFVEGVKITDHTLIANSEKTRLAREVTRALVAHPIFATSPAAMFHSDPHAGNMLYTSCGKIVLLDWSLVGHLHTRERIAMVQIMLAAIALQTDRIVRVLEGLSERRPADPSTLRRVVANWLRKLRRGQLPGMTWLVGMLDEAVQEGRLNMPHDMMLFRKALLTLEGVIQDLGEDQLGLDEVLLLEFLKHFGSEFPSRFLCDPTSRKFVTRLSNTDLAETLLNMSMLVPRFWLGEWEDLVNTQNGAGGADWPTATSRCLAQSCGSPTLANANQIQYQHST